MEEVARELFDELRGGVGREAERVLGRVEFDDVGADGGRGEGVQEADDVAHTQSARLAVRHAWRTSGGAAAAPRRKDEFASHGMPMSVGRWPAIGTFYVLPSEMPPPHLGSGLR